MPPPIETADYRHYAQRPGPAYRYTEIGHLALLGHYTGVAPEQLPPLSAAVEVACYRIAQEALTNVMRR